MMVINRLFLFALILLVPFFSTFSQSGKIHYSIYNGDYDVRRVNVDGSVDEQVYLTLPTEQVDAITIDPVNNKLYYFALDGTNGHKVYKSDLDGSNRTTFMTGKKLSSMVYFSGKIYYSTVEGDYDVRRVNTDGTSDELVYLPPGTEQVNYLTTDASGSKLFLAAVDATLGNKLYKSDLNGSNLAPFISGVKISSLAYSGGKIYYSRIDGDYAVRRVNTDGSSDELVYMPPVTEQINCLTIDGSTNKLFLAGGDGTNGDKIYKSDLNGTNMETIFPDKKIKALANFNDPALPVELSLFIANVSGSSVDLIWQTATETNNYGFEVERNNPPLNPLQGGEEELWETIGFVEGSGNSNSVKNYSFVDDKVSTGKYSYRLKQVDNDGQFEYSKAVEVSFMKPNEFSLDQNYPNPFNPTTTIYYTVADAYNASVVPVRLVVYDVLGNEVATLVNEYRDAGSYEINFDGSNLPSGVYMYKLQAGEYTQTRKMTLVK